MKKVFSLSISTLTVIATFTTFTLIPTQVAISQSNENQVRERFLSYEEVLEKIKQHLESATVQFDSFNEQGSGVIIEKRGNTYTVLTNRHVVHGFPSNDYKIITSDGITHKINNVIKGGDEIDLALVYFTSQEQYNIMSKNNSEKLNSGQRIHYGGYPASNTVQTERTYYYYLDEKIVTVLPENDVEEGYALRITGEALPGLSGSPVFNQNFQLIGIYGKTKFNSDTGQNQLLAIPIDLADKLAKRNGIQLKWKKETKSILHQYGPFCMPGYCPPKNTNPPKPSPPIDIAYQPNRNYDQIPLRKLANSAFHDLYDRKYVSFSALYMNIGNWYFFHRYYLSPSEIKNYIILDVRTSSGTVPMYFYVLVDKTKIDDILKLEPFDVLKIDGYTRIENGKISNYMPGLNLPEINMPEAIIMEVHKIQKLGTSLTPSGTIDWSNYD